jgi:hypothetical protein
MPYDYSSFLDQTLGSDPDEWERFALVRYVYGLEEGQSVQPFFLVHPQ